jgi:DNA-binding GntR family transcriptional regulator
MPYRTKAEIVFEYLREQILSGELRPGDPVPISHVARQLGVSDIPAREGVKRLEAVGLLTFETHKGAVVARMGREEVEEMFAIRTELEALALRQAATRITPTELAELRSILDEMAVAEKEGRVEDYGKLNREFHFCAYSSQPYRKLLRMIESLWDSTDWCRRIFVAESDSIRASLVEHEVIYDALARGDGEAASVFLRAQKQRAVQWLLKQIDDVDSQPDTEELRVNKRRKRSTRAHDGSPRERSAASA